MLAANQNRIVAMGMFGLLWCGSCAPGDKAQYERHLEGAGPPALHAVHSERLQQLMKHMGDVTRDRMPQEMDGGAERDQRIREVRQAAGGIAETATHIPEILKDVQMSEEHREVFVTLARQLRTQSLALQAAANRNDLRALNDGMQTIMTTCNACHNAFRVLPVVPD